MPGSNPTCDCGHNLKEHDYQTTGTLIVCLLADCDCDGFEEDLTFGA
jgi:hypothetical protein